MNCCDFNGLPYVPRREISSAFLRVEVTTLPFPERFDQCRFCSVRTKCVQHFLNNSDEELHTKAQWLRFFVIFYYTLPSSCSPPPRHPLFSPFYPPVPYLFTYPCSLSPFLIFFLPLNYITIILLFICSFIHRLIISFHHVLKNHSSPPLSYFPTHVPLSSISYYHTPSPLTKFFSYPPLEISIAFFTFILHLLPFPICSLSLLQSRNPQLTSQVLADAQGSPASATSDQLLRVFTAVCKFYIWSTT